MTQKPTPRLRCAVYTRKSTADGLEQDYNSIDAQRDAGHAYINSQRAEGWLAVDDDYDDPAYSGSNMERPALQRLLSDIEHGKIDIIVVYKIDRLTRSLTDFAKMVDVFDKYHVSFVAVTQQINSATSMGRLMLNVLLSFAQFEREITAERVRDKVAASKKKGLWMAGVPPLGYDLDERRLVVNETEANTVRHIFSRFIALKGATTALVKELQTADIKSKTWITNQGTHKPGRLIDKSVIYRVLHNRTYLGEMKNKHEWYPNTHDAIIDPLTWDKAQTILKHNYRTRGNHQRTRIPFLLKGMVFAKDGRALTTTSSHKQNTGRHYRYYVHTPMIKEHAGASSLPRISAADLEAQVITQLRTILKSPSVMQQAAIESQQLGDTFDEAQATVVMTQLETVWDQLFPNEQHRIIHLLVDKILVDDQHIELHLHQHGIPTLARQLIVQQHNNQGHRHATITAH